jgi:hypothetical protein
MSNEHCPLPESEWEQDEGTPVELEPAPSFTNPRLIEKAEAQLVEEIVSTNDEHRQAVYSDELAQLRELRSKHTAWWEANPPETPEPAVKRTRDTALTSTPAKRKRDKHLPKKVNLGPD